MLCHSPSRNRDAHQSVKECCEFRDLDRLGVGGKNYVLVVHLHPGGEEIAGRIAKAHRIDNRHAIRRSATV